jgi:hypothetical protein
MSVIRATRLRVVAVSLFTMAVLSCGTADGALAGAKPLKITHFSLLTTRTEKAPGPLTHLNWGFVNESAPFAQAGGHLDGQGGGADALTADIEFETQTIEEPPTQTHKEPELKPVPTRDPKDIVVDIPTGLLGNPTAVPRCPLEVVVENRQCPASTQIGEAVLYILHGNADAGPIVNVTPEAGQSAEFAIETTSKLNFLLTGHVVRTSEGYGLTVVTNSIPTTEIYRAETSFWGVPASSIHDPERGLFCGRTNGNQDKWGCANVGKPTGGEKSGIPEVPFLTMPANCQVGPEPATVKADSWEEPGRYVEAQTEMPGMSDCNLTQFNPGIEINPDTTLADAPVGLGVNLLVPQFEEPERPATPEMSKAVVTLPLGMSVSPGIVDGIQACEERGPDGIEMPNGLNAQGEPLQPDEMGEGEELGSNGEPQLAPGHCPNASIIGTAKATTPLLSEPIEGHVYLARPGCGNAALRQRPCTEHDALDGNLYQLYLELGGQGALAGTGVNIKVRLKTEANPATGQLTTVAEEIAQLPFSKLELKLNGGPRAPLDNPPVCGTATTTADFTPWAAPGTTPEGVFMPGLPDATPSSFFDVEGCASPTGLNPGFVAGTVTPNAGKFSAFTLNISRQDREQYIKGVQVHTPPGLLGVLASVPLCSEVEANEGECPEASKIGTTRVASGAGSHPFEIEGNMYLTTSYRGAPFGLAVVTNAVAGPFDLGKVVVRARIDVDPTDSTLTITTDETGPYAVPQILFGVPLRLQRITVNVSRPQFMFNPTNCKAQRISAKISGSQETVSSVSSPFAVGNCTALAFKPTFKVSTSAHTSRANGASLVARVSYPKGAMGSYANIARVKVSLPKQLPSRLETLKKACSVETFDNDPAACPAASIVGIAESTTPLLPVKLAGPAYFVSFGGEAFPELIVVLQGDGVRVDLAGSTFISKGITSSTFKTVPDVPVNSFQLYLPEGHFSALAANGSLCRAAASGKLLMPTEFDAQNGAVIRQKTKIAVTGCVKKGKTASVKRRRHA